MKTTLNIDEHLLVAAKKRAAELRITLTRLIEDALREALNRRPEPDAYSFRDRWPVVEQGQLPSVDISDRDALYERMEGRG